MKLTIIGCGDAFGSGGRFNSCLLAEAEGDRLLVDCGSSSMVALNRAGIDRNTLRALLFTHFHGDHFGALPAFLLEAQFVVRREAPLTIAGPAGIERRTWEAVERDFPGASENRWRFDIRDRKSVV